MQAKDDQIMAALQSELLRPSAHVSIARVLAAKSDLLGVQRTSSGRERAAVQCQINKVLIGRVNIPLSVHVYQYIIHTLFTTVLEGIVCCMARCLAYHTHMYIQMYG